VSPEQQVFFSSALSAGAILTGFCGTFLSFRIQREANYYRQPVVDFKSGKAADVVVGLSHFTSSFLMLILASVMTSIFGFVLPLLALSGALSAAVLVKVVAGGLTSSLLLICGYFLVEMRHYRILNRNLLRDKTEWGEQMPVVVVVVIAAAVIFTVVAFIL
jgi:hypothetical protein